MRSKPSPAGKGDRRAVDEESPNDNVTIDGMQHGMPEHAAADEKKRQDVSDSGNYGIAIHKPRRQSKI